MQIVCKLKNANHETPTSIELSWIEHLPSKQAVEGSNPSAITKKRKLTQRVGFFNSHTHEIKITEKRVKDFTTTCILQVFVTLETRL